MKHYEAKKKYELLTILTKLYTELDSGDYEMATGTCESLSRQTHLLESHLLEAMGNKKGALKISMDLGLEAELTCCYLDAIVYYERANSLFEAIEIEEYAPIDFERRANLPDKIKELKEKMGP